MRLLVADDEKIVQDSIRLIIQRERLSDIQLEVASSGGAAIERAMVFRPDVIFMDINMPGLNGLEAIQSIQEFAPDVIVVIITAYDVFEYAQSGIRCGVYEYLVKPFTPQDIMRLLTEIRGKMERLYTHEKELIQMRESVASMQGLMNLGILNILITRTDMISVLEREAPQSLTLGGSIALLNVGSEDGRHRAKHKIKEFETQRDGTLFGTFVEGNLTLFLPRSVPVRSLYDRLAAVLDPDDFSLSCGCMQTSLRNLWVSYHQAVEAYCVLSGTLRMYHTGTQVLEDRISDYRKLARQCLDSSSLELASDPVLWKILVPEDLHHSILNAAHTTMLLAESLYQKNPQNFQYSDEINQLLARITSAENSAELQIAFLATAERVRQLAGTAADGLQNVNVRGVIHYMDAHLSENLTLESAARQMNLSPSTLSRLFKKSTGKGFVEVLTEKRIQKAIQLIQTGAYSMKEVCFMVGYNDPNYFSRTFKRVTGKNPTEFKE